MKKMNNRKYFLLLVSASLLTISPAAAMQSINDLVPNQTVNGTQGRLATGFFYSIHVKRWPDTYVSYTNEESGGGRYMQVASKESDKYKQNGEWRDDALWIIKPSEVIGHYSLSVKRWPDTYVSYANKESGGGRYMQVAWKESDKYKQNGEWRDDALWIIKPSEVIGHYSLSVKRWPDTYVSYTNEESGGGRYMQVAWKESNKYKQGGEWRDDALFSFVPSAYELSAIITDFKYDPMVENLNTLAKQSVSSVAWTMDNNSYNDTIIAHPNIHQSRQNQQFSF
jgi:hypothetical protein